MFTSPLQGPISPSRYIFLTPKDGSSFRYTHADARVHARTHARTARTHAQTQYLTRTHTDPHIHTHKDTNVHRHYLTLLAVQAVHRV